MRIERLPFELPANDNARRAASFRLISPLPAVMRFCPHCGGVLEEGDSADDCSVALRFKPVRAG